MLKPELLAPAGSRAAFEAAIAAGADAVYLGAGAFNARRNAENFAPADLVAACRDAHLRGRKVYLTANTLVFEGEADEALHTVVQAAEAGVDAAIIQDVGLAQTLRRELPELELHTSTQMNIRDEAGVRLARELGFTRVTLARELSLKRIARLAQLGMPLECFVHGALCICQSGQCLLSSMIGGRSANRGLCAQPCRLPYKLVDEQGAQLAAPGAYLLSPKDLCGLELLPQFVEAGVASLKIEGRMKAPQYVCTVTAVYRQALDRLWHGLQAAGEDECTTLAAASSAAGPATPVLCSASDGVVGASDSDTDTAACPAATYAAPYWHDAGEFVGHAPTGDAPAPADPAAPFAPYPEERELLAEAFSRGFTPAYLAGECGNEMMGYTRPNNRGVPVGRVAGFADGRVLVDATVPLQRGDVLELWTCKGRVTHTCSHGDDLRADAVKLAIEQRVAKGDRVFRVVSAALAQRVSRQLERGWRIPVRMSVRFPGVGRPIEVKLGDFAGHEAHVQGPAVEPARSKPITIEEVERHMGRFGGTPYELRECSVSMLCDEGGEFGCSFSVLHKLRAQAVEALERQILAGPGPAMPTAQPQTAGRAAGTGLAVDAPGPVSGPAGVTTPPPAPPLARVATGGSEMAAHATTLDFSRPLAGGNVARTLEEFAPGRAIGPKLYATNADALATWAALGASFVWLSPELTLHQIRALARESPLPLGLVVSGRQELMVSGHCFLVAEGPCNRQCAHCKRRLGAPRFYEDRKGYRFPVRVDEQGCGHLYNAVPLDVTHAIDELLAAGVSGFAVDATLMGARERDAELERVTSALNGHVLQKRPDTTTGHLFRRVK